MQTFFFFLDNNTGLAGVPVTINIHLQGVQGGLAHGAFLFHSWTLLVPGLRFGVSDDEPVHVVCIATLRSTLDIHIRFRYPLSVAP